MRKVSSPWLTMSEAVAWVKYRRWEAVERSHTAEGLTALIFYGLEGESQNFPREVGSRDELRQSLAQGNLVAFARKEGEYEQIPSLNWRHLPIAPLLPTRTAPYTDIVIRRDELLKKWPEQPRKGLSSFEKDLARRLYDELRQSRPAISNKQAARELLVGYEKAVRHETKPSHSTLMRWIKEWKGGARENDFDGPSVDPGPPGGS
jgi:hypothetical protein